MLDRQTGKREWVNTVQLVSEDREKNLSQRNTASSPGHFLDSVTQSNRSNRNNRLEDESKNLIAEDWNKGLYTKSLPFFCKQKHKILLKLAYNRRNRSLIHIYSFRGEAKWHR